MDITGMNNNITPDYNTKVSKENKTDEDRNSLNYEDFLSLFVTSLQYQDPSAPMDNSEMMNQMSQIGFMQAVSEMQTTISDLKESVLGNQILEGTKMLDKDVTATASDGQLIKGKVESVQMNNDGLLELLVNNKTITLGSVVNVSNENEKGVF